MKKYEELIEQIKSSQPVIYNSERLTFNILQTIEKIPQKKSENKVLTIVAWATSIAASLLIGLLIFDQLTILESRNHQSSKIPETYLGAASIEKKTELTNFNDWFCIKKTEQKKQQALYSNIMNYYKPL